MDGLSDVHAPFLKSEGFKEKDRKKICCNQHVLINLPSEGIKIVELILGKTVNLGKFGAFNSDEIFGYPFGQAFEVLEEGKVRPIKSVRGTGDEHDNSDDDDASKQEFAKAFSMYSQDNQQIADIGSKIQKLTAEDIDKLKKSGTSSDVGQKIIEQIITGHGGFDKKTIFSQQKYLRRKQKKFLRRFQVENLGTSQLLKYYIEKDASKVRDISEESLGLLLSYANVRPGGNYILLDDTGGVILYALMERMAGQGSILCINENEHPNHSVLRYSDYSEELYERQVKNANWLQFTEPESVKVPWTEVTESELEHMKTLKRAQYFKREKRAKSTNEAIALIEKGNFDAFISVSSLHIPSILPYVLPKIGGSRPIVIYSPYKELLMEIQNCLIADRKVLGPCILETRMRPYQSLLGRMHPVMTMRGYGGYIVWGTRVFPKEAGIQAAGKGAKRSKRVNYDGDDVMNNEDQVEQVPEQK